MMINPCSSQAALTTATQSLVGSSPHILLWNWWVD